MKCPDSGKKVILAAIIALLSVIVVLMFQKELKTSPTQNAQATPLKRMSLDDVPINVILADSVEERNQGLSGRESLAKDQGMLFIFPEPGKYSFWMKNMRFPIDIIWIGQDRRVAGILPNIRPDTFPQTFAPNRPVSYVLEVNSGWSLKNKIKLGSLMAGGLPDNTNP